jgi:hypothetical protein
MPAAEFDDLADAPTEELHLYAALVPGLPPDHPLADCAVVAGQTLLVGGETPAARMTFVATAADAREPTLELRRFLSLWGRGVVALLPYAATREELQFFLDHGVVPDQNDDAMFDESDDDDDGLDY